MLTAKHGVSKRPQTQPVDSKDSTEKTPIYDRANYYKPMDFNPYFVAEISANHNGSFDRAVALIEAAAKNGANAVKFQTYKPETMTLPIDSFQVSNDHELWGGVNLFELYTNAMTPWEWHRDLFQHAHELGITPFSSPFDRSAVDFLEDLNCSIYKIASLETGDVDLISYISETGKPIIISTGASSLKEVEQAVVAARSGKSSEIYLLVCTSSYPSQPLDAHIRRIQTLENEFGSYIGISDHTLGVGVSIAAIALGAKIVEKHLTLSRKDGGADASFSMEPNEFKILVEEGRNASLSLGSSEWNELSAETESRRLRRSLYICKDVKKGDIVTRENVKSLRPNSGAPISNLPRILGKRFKNDYGIGTPALETYVE